MRMARAAGLALALAVLLAACSAPVAVQTSAVPSAEETPPAPAATPATAQLARRLDDTWQPVTALDSHVAPGPAELRLAFSKPVRRQEVEIALTAAQAAPVRGAMQWMDDRTLIWSVSNLPPRLDFLLGGAHDQDGLPLPGGLAALFTGEPPRLVEVDTATGAEQLLALLPPDVLSAGRSSDGLAINLLVWTPGTSRWDSQTRDFHMDLGAPALRPGRVDGAQPRLATELENWTTSRQSGFVAGLRTAREPETGEVYKAALVVVEPRSGRQQVYRAFIDRYVSPQTGDYTTHLTWDGEGQRVAALSHREEGADLVALDIQSGERTVLAENLPVPAFSTRLAWSPDSRYVLAGNLLVDLQTRSFQRLPGTAAAQSEWAPAGAGLLYGEEWGPLFLVAAESGSVRPLGPGLIAGWGEAGHAYLIRWPASGARYRPPGTAAR
jgi:hypothetical protein